MNIGEIGVQFDSTNKIDFLSDRTFLEFDYLIINIQYLQIGHDESRRNRYEKRKQDLSELILYKKIPLILFSSEVQTISFLQRTTGGTSKRIKYPINSIIPIPEFETELQSGNNIIITPKTIFSEFLKKYEAYFHYDTFFTKFEGTVIAEIPHSKKTLAFYNKESIFLPKVKSTIKAIEKEFVTELIEVVKKINSEKNQPLHPEWVHQYFLPNEKEIKDDISNIRNEIISLSKKLQEKEEVIASFLNKKVLFTGTGNDLEFEIQTVFKELGFEILEAEINRDDLIVKYDNKIAVVEIKGINGSAAEKHATQLEKWVATYYDRKETKAKGILITNTFKDLKLGERINKSFPDQMVSEYSIPRGHCLITSLQLLGMYYDVINNPSNKEKIIESLFNTIGVYNGYEKWEEFIQT